MVALNLAEIQVEVRQNFLLQKAPAWPQQTCRHTALQLQFDRESVTDLLQ
jgi:hypothetical protein